MSHTIESMKAQFRKLKGRNGAVWNRQFDGKRWLEDIDSSGLRLVGFADEILKLRHTGWFTDSEFQDETLRGVVLQLPARAHRAQYLAAYADPNNEGAYMVSMEIFEGDIRDSSWDDDSGKREAARAADGLAERDAESEREYQEAWRAGQDYAELGAEVESHRSDALALIQEIKSEGKTFAPAICAALRAHVTSHLADIRRARAKREKLLDSVWCNRLNAAFNDGAGASILKP